MLTDDLPKLLENQKSYAGIPECKFVVRIYQSIALKNCIKNHVVLKKSNK